MGRRITRSFLAGCLVILASLAFTSGHVAAADTNSTQATWRVSYFKNYGTGYCVDGYRARGGYTAPCNSGNFQRFVLDTTRGARTTLRSVGETTGGKKWCLGAYGGSVQMQECNSSLSRQYWVLLYTAGSNHPQIYSPPEDKCMRHAPPLVGLGTLSLEYCSFDSRFYDRRWGLVLVG